MAATTKAPAKRKYTASTYTAKPIPETGFVRLPSILAAIPVSRTTFHNGVRSGRFPKPVKLGLRTVAWKAEDIRALLESLANRPSV